MSRGEQQQQQAVAEATAAPISPSLSKSPLQESDEWDASKVPPSRFQKRKGSIYAVPSSRDGRIDSNYATKFHEKLEEMALRGKKRGSVSQ
ncbi:hypothetical protein VTJ04DRAFT_4842 [Mycothermus thermophilus]|uniref:uncharacterized protein n=1 Tax=Humicola insolens TaxID=85995 RepID=UPI0037441CD5